MAYHFMLGVVPLPINPSALNIKTPSLNKTVQLINDAEINIPKDHGLREVSFDFLLPTFQKYPFASYQLGDLTAATIIVYLKWWKSSRLPLPFIVVRMSPRGKFLYFTSFKCVIEDFTFDEDAKEHGFDTMCSITLKEYVDYGTKRVKLKKTQNGQQQQASTKRSRTTSDRQTQSTTTVREGETPAHAQERAGGQYSSTIEGEYERVMGKYDMTNGKKEWESAFEAPTLGEGKSPYTIQEEIYEATNSGNVTTIGGSSGGSDLWSYTDATGKVYPSGAEQLSPPIDVGGGYGAAGGSGVTGGSSGAFSATNWSGVLGAGR